jgi:hypothetical protein
MGPPSIPHYHIISCINRNAGRYWQSAIGITLRCNTILGCPSDTLLNKAMYRCYLVRAGRIAMGDDLDVDTLDEAIACGCRLLAAQPEAENFSGIEIWARASLLYSDDCSQITQGV